MWTFLALLALGLSGFTQNAVREKTAKGEGLQNRILGGLGHFEDGAGLLLLDGYLLVETVVKKGDRLELGLFLLDTGCRPACRIEKWFAEKIGWSEGEKVTLKLGTAYLDELVPLVKPCPLMHDLSKRRATVLVGSGVCGSIGMKALFGKKVHLDFRSYRLKIEPASVTPAEKKGEPAGGVAGRARDQVPFSPIPFPSRLDVTINGKVAAPFQLSTACPASWVDKELAFQAGWRKGKAPASLLCEDVELTDESLRFVFRKRKKEADPAALPGEDAANPIVSSKTPVGVLGNDFLKRFCVTFDTVNGTITLERIPPPRQAERR